MKRYRIYGLAVKSELELPELDEDAEGGAADIVIRRRPIRHADAARVGVTRQCGGALTTVGDVGRFWSGRRTVLVDALPGASARNVRLFLLGTALGMVLHQRGLLPLHANAVEIGGRAVAFLGHSGAGKSTLASWFVEAGYRLLSDDVCVIGFDDGRAVAHPGIPRLRLWHDAVEQRGGKVEDYHRSFDGEATRDKYDVPVPRWKLVRDAVPIERIYVLQRAAAGEAAVEPLRGARAVAALVANTYRGEQVPIIGDPARHWQSCVTLARLVPVFTASREWGFGGFEAQCEMLASHVRDFGR